MTKILVWVLVIHSWHGGVDIYDNLASQDSCERMLSRIKAASTFNSGPSIRGSCTQVEKFVPASTPTNISVNPPAITVNSAPARVIIKEAKK